MPAAKDWRKFCEEFVRLGGTLSTPNGKATAAAKTCGYSDPTQSAYRLLKKDQVRELIVDLVKASLAKSCETIPSADEILLSINTIAKDDKVYPSVRLKALELLGKYRALFSEKLLIETPRRIIIDDHDGSNLTTLGSHA